MQSGWGERPLPKVGIEELDKLAVGTTDYRLWKGLLESNGVKVVEKPLRQGLRGYFESATELRVDPNQFRVLDILHETRHYKQIRRAKAAGSGIDFSSLNKARLGIAEYERKGDAVH